MNIADIPALVNELARSVYPYPAPSSVIERVTEIALAKGTQVGWLYGALVTIITDELERQLAVEETAGASAYTTATLPPPSVDWYGQIIIVKDPGLDGAFYGCVLLADGMTYEWRLLRGGVAGPEITAFSVPLMSASLTVAVVLEADMPALGGLFGIISEDGDPPLFDDVRWGALPTEFTFAAEGSNAAYAWVMNAAGEISSRRSASCVVTLPVDAPPDAPTITSPATSNTYASSVDVVFTGAPGLTGIAYTGSVPVAAVEGPAGTYIAAAVPVALGANVLTATLTGSGGESSHSASVTVTRLDLPLDETSPISFAVVGDSISSKFGGPSNPPGDPGNEPLWPVAWPERLVAQMPPGSRVNNQAIAGETTLFQLSRFEAAIRYGSEEFVVILCGINDNSVDVPVADTLANVEMMGTEAESAGKRVVLVSLLPMKGDIYGLWSSTRQTHLDERNVGLAALAAANGWTWVDAASALWDPSDHLALRPAYTWDGLHLSEAGQSVLIGLVKPQMQSQVTAATPVHTSDNFATDQLATRYDASGPGTLTVSGGVLTITGGGSGQLLRLKPAVFADLADTVHEVDFRWNGAAGDLPGVISRLNDAVTGYVFALTSADPVGVKLLVSGSFDADSGYGDFGWLTADRWYTLRLIVIGSNVWVEVQDRDTLKTFWQHTYSGGDVGSLGAGHAAICWTGGPGTGISFDNWRIAKAAKAA